MKFWLSQRVRTVAAFSALSLGMATLAVLHDGTETADLNLNDGGVWVTNLSLPGGRAVAAHLNYPSRELDSYTEPAMTLFDVSQAANEVVLHDAQGPRVATVDTRTWQAGAVATFPRGAVGVQGSEVVAVADSNQGKVWVVPSSQPESFSTESTPVIKDAIGVRVAVGLDDTVHAVTPDGDLQVAVRGSSGWQSRTVGSVPTINAETDQWSVAAIGGVGVVLNSTAGWLAWPDHKVELPEAAGAVLQQSGHDVGTVAVQTPSALHTVDLETGDVETRHVAGDPSVIAPVTVGVCTYAAWLGTGHYIRDCAGDSEDVEQDYPQLVGVDPQTTRFRFNREVVVLNEASTGKIFLVNEDMALIDDWATIASQLELDEKKDQQDDVATQEFDRPKENRPPKAEPDRFGVRAGVSVTLPVLANDTDPDGDVLLATPAHGDTRVGSVEPVRQGRAVRLTVPADAAGGDTFTYTASDGRRNGEAEAEVQIEVHEPSVNGGPVLIPGRSSNLTMVERGSGEHRILQEWMDPDGDPFWIDHVEFPTGMDGAFRPDGLVKVNDSGTEVPGRREINVFLTDGRDQTKAVLTVSVKPRGTQLPPVANADFVTAEVGEPVVVSPLTNDVDPNGDELFLTQVEPTSTARTEGDLTDGTVTVAGSSPGTEYLRYAISDGPNSATGVVRLDVKAPDASSAKPIPDNDLAVLPSSGETLVDVLSNDTDPLGGVLVLQSVTQPAGGGVTAEVVDHEVLRLHNTGMAGPVTLTYVVGNANGSSTGSVTVVQSQADDAGTPLAYDDRATVRSGDVVSVDVLANDISPGDRPLHVRPDLDVVDGAELGVAFVSEDRVRFKADADHGTVRIKYTVEDPDQNASTGTLEVNIQPLSGSNTAPAPKILTARLIEGGSTPIAVPLDDIDPDGDSATLLGLDKAPTKGVATVSAGVITYTSSGGTAGTGTDAFSYLVEDRFGEQAVGQVRVGIAPPPSANQPPIPAADVVAARPNRLVSIPVTANDIDPEGESLTLIADSIQPVDQATSTKTTIEQGRVQLTTPKKASVLRYTYSVSDDVRNVSEGAINVQVDPEAPLLPPTARDDVVPLADVVGQTQVTVKVLDNDEDPDGAASILSPATTVPGVTPTSDGQLVIPLTPERQVIVYSITDADNQTGQAVVMVPGTDSLAAKRPVVRPDAPLPLKVKAGETLTIPVADHVAVRQGRTPTVPFTENVQPGPGWDGGKKLEDPQTLVFTSEPDFHGLTSTTFVVTDSTGEADGDALTSTLTLPIEVESNGQTRPTLVAPAIEVTPGEEPWVRDLRELANDPDPGDQAELTFAVSGTPDGLTATIGEDGSTLSVAANDDATVGTSRSLTLTVADQSTEPVSVDAVVTVVASTRPLMTVRPAVLDDVDAGQQVEVDLTDYVTNPYADLGEPISVVGQPRVAGGSATATAAGQTIVIRPAEDFHGTLTVTYVVADASQDVGRQIQGQIRVNVRAAPEAPTAVEAVATKSHTVDVSWRAGANNGAPITGYTVSWTGGESGSRTVGNRTSLTIGDLTNNRDYVFTVRATNTVGDSEESAPSRKARPDEVPAAPAGVKLSFGNGSIDVSWTQPRYEGSPVRKYQVSYNGQIATTEGPQRRLTLTGLSNGTTYAIKVRGINDAETERDGVAGAGPWSQSAAEHPNDEPSAPNGIQVDADGPDPDPSAVVSWAAAAPNGEPVTKYEVRKNSGGTVACERVSETSCRVSLTVGEDATFSVRAYNRANPTKPAIDGWSEWSGNSAPVRGAKPPGGVSNLRVVPTGESGRARVTFDPAEKNGAETIEYHYSAQGAGSGLISSGDVISGLAEGADRSVDVWAVSAANGKSSEPGEHRSDPVNTFGRCTVSITRVDSSYDRVTFFWNVISHGRPCAVSYSGGGGDGTGGSRSGQESRGNGPNQTHSLQVTARTVTSGDDPTVPDDLSNTASGSTWSPGYEVRHPGTACAAGSPPGCRRVEVRPFSWRPNSRVRCTAQGTNGISNWSHIYNTNGSGDGGWSSTNDAGGHLFDTPGDAFRDGTNTGEFTCTQL